MQIVMRTHTRKKGAPAIYFKKNIYPGNDFYQYVNGKWLESAHLPPTAHSTGVTHTMQKTFDNCIIYNAKKLIKSTSFATGNGFISHEQKKQIRHILSTTRASVEKFSHSCTSNQIAITRLLSQINSIETKEDIAYTIGYLNAYQIPNIINIGTSQDSYDRNYQVVKFFMGDYSIGDRQYYWNHEFGTTNLFEAYESYLKQMGSIWNIEKIVNVPKLERKAHQLYQRVIGQSESSRTWSKTSLIESFPILNSIFNGLSEAAHTIEWSRAEYAIDKTATIHFLNSCIETFSIEEWKVWFYTFIINFYAPYICPNSARIHHQFFGKTLTGLPAFKTGDDMWLEVLKNSASIILNEFSREFCIDLRRRKEVQYFFKRIQKSTINILNDTEWLDPPTRTKAIEKVSKLNIDIAFPNGSYKFPIANMATAVQSESLIENIMELNRTDFEYGIKAVYAVNHTPWDNPVFAVNAHYWDYENRIFFPGAILEPPNFLCKDAGQSSEKKRQRRTRKTREFSHRLGWNYGNLGATLGHEITHAFDIEGMKVDHDGIRHTWATKDDQNQYKKKVEALETFYKKVKQDGLELDTPYIISEAIADLGGLSIALHALKKEMEELGWSILRKQEEIRWFFIAYGYSWQQKMRPMARIRRVYMDEHPPAWTRVNYIVNQFTEWYEAFGVRGGDLYVPPEERVQFFSG
jgi:putative endopeptidase